MQKWLMVAFTIHVCLCNDSLNSTHGAQHMSVSMDVVLFFYCTKIFLDVFRYLLVFERLRESVTSQKRWNCEFIRDCTTGKFLKSLLNSKR